MTSLPRALIQKLMDVHEDASTWLESFPKHLQTCERNWSIKVTSLVEELSYNVVALAEGSDGSPAILKMSPPSEDFEREALAIQTYNGEGMCRLIKVDMGMAAMLLERIYPGRSLWLSDDNALATHACASLLKQLWRPAEGLAAFRDLKSWSSVIPEYLITYKNQAGPLSYQMVQKACDLLEERLATPESYLLHADLHHGNILSATRQSFLAIDPKGIVGPRGYDIGPWLMNPASLSNQSNILEIQKERLEIFHEMLSFDKAEIAIWGFIHCVLSACWDIEEGDGDARHTTAVAQVLEQFF